VSGAFQAPTGTRDVLAPESSRWEMLVGSFARLVEGAGYGLVLSPLFEDVGVFARGMGETTEVVTKEMYEFADKGDRRLALRPEGTASIVRAFVQHRPPLPWKVWYVTPAFRYERPQAGRYRQHHQVGLEALGTEDPELDVEVVALAADFAGRLGLSRLTLKLNSMGDSTCRPAYTDRLRSYVEAHTAELCREHQARWSANPLRVLDCKRPECVKVAEGAPRLSDFLCPDCENHFSRVREGLSELGVAYVLDHRLVRGLDYYTRTTFEVASDALDAAQDAVGGGGRYDGLVESLGGPPTPGIGFGMGIERLLLACDAEGALGIPENRLDAFVVDLTGGAAARRLTRDLRAAGLRVDRAFDDRSLKAQLKAADRSGASVALIVGPDEVEAGTVALRPLRGDGNQETVPRQRAVSRTRELAGR
jgi:histidyl-tRNA synthetase